MLGDGDPGDDVALLAVRPHPVATTGSACTLPAEPESLARLRRRLARFLHAAGAAETEQYEVTLTVCEAAGNAIEHAYGPGDATFEVEVALRRTASSRPRCATAAAGASGAASIAAGASTIIEGLMDDVDVTAGAEGTVVTMRRRLAAARAA